MYHKYFLYLIQGRKENVLKYSYLQNENADLIALTFDLEILENELNSISTIFLPNSTWAEGRNKQLEDAKKLDSKYLYYIFIDDDVEFIKGTFSDFEQQLLKNKPAIGVPLLTIIKNTYRYNHNLKIQHPFAVDQQVQAYHYKVIEESIVMPLETKFDKLSWWYSCEINSFLILSYYRGYSMQFNEIIVDNLGHNFDSLTNISNDTYSNYIGGVTNEGLDEVRNFIENKYGIQPKLRNSLFHDNNFKKHNYLKNGKDLHDFYSQNFLSGNIKKCIAMLVSQYKNKLKKYPSNLILNEMDFKIFDSGLIKKMSK